MLAGFSPSPLILSTAAPGDQSGVRPGKLRADVDPPRPPLPLGPTQWTVPLRSLARRAKAEPGRRLLSQTRNRHIGRNPRSPPPTEAAQWARLPRFPPGPLSATATERRGEGQARPRGTRGRGRGETERDNPERTERGRVPEKPKGTRDNLAPSLRGGNDLLQGQKTPEETTYGCMCV